MAVQENKEKARRFLEEGFGQGNLEVVDEVLDPDFVCYDPNSEAGEVRGPTPSSKRSSGSATPFPILPTQWKIR